MSELNPKVSLSKGDCHLKKFRGTPRQRWRKLIWPLLVSVPFLFLFLFLPVTLAYARPEDNKLNRLAEVTALDLSGDHLHPNTDDFLRPAQQVTTTLQVQIIGSPYATVDSNGVSGSVSGDIPKVMVVEAVVTNTGVTAASDLVVQLDYNATGDWILLAGEEPTRTQDELGVGQTYHAYWLVRYPYLPPDGLTHPYTVTAQADNAQQVSASATIQTRSSQSTGNQALTYSSANVVVGVAFTVTVGFDLGNSPDELTFSPIGNIDFDPSAYRLVASHVRIFKSDLTQQAIFTDQLYFPALPTYADYAEKAEVTYTFLALTPTNTRLCPYTDIRFGSNPKYDQQFCSNTLSTTVPITGSISLSLAKQVDRTFTEQGKQLTYTINYTNSGDQQLQYVWIWDEYPANLAALIPASASQAYDPDETTDGVVAWYIGNIAAAGQLDSSGTLTFSVLVDGDGQDIPDGTLLANRAFLGINPGSLPALAALSSTVTTTIQAPIMAFSKTDQQTTVQPGDLLSYTLRFTNTGSAAAASPVVSDTLPANVAVVGSTTPPIDSAVGQTLVWNSLTAIPAGGGSLIITVPVRVDPALAEATILTNLGTIEYHNNSSHTFDLKTASDITFVEIPTTTLILAKHAEDINGSPLVVGDTIRYTLVVTNTGFDTAFNVTVIDDLPSGVTYMSDSPDQGTTVEDNGNITWTIPTLAADSNNIATLLITATINPDQANQVITNTGSVTATNVTDPPADPDPVCPDGSPEPCDPGHTPVPTTTLTIDKVAEDVDGPPLLVGDAIRYTLQVTNTGSYTAFNVIVSDALPAGVTYVNATADQGTPTETGGALTWTIPQLSASNNNVATLLITVTINSDQVGQIITNTGSVTGNNVPTPPPPTSPVCPDGAPEPCDPGHTPDPVPTTLALAKTAADVNGAPLVVGDTIRYTLVVTNTGPAAALDVIVTDDLPGGVTYVAASADHGTPGQAGGTITWTIPELPANSNNVATLLITATINSDQAGQNITNTGSVTGTNVPIPPPDPTPVCPDGSPEPCDPGHTPVPTTTLTLAKFAQDADGSPLLVGDTISYTLQVANTGSYTAFNVVVTDNLPDQVTCQSVSGDYAPAGCADPLLWTIATLGAGETASLEIGVTINPGTEGQSIINSASVTASNVPNPPPGPAVCPDGSLPDGDICIDIAPGPSGSFIYLPLIVKSTQ